MKPVTCEILHRVYDIRQSLADYREIAKLRMNWLSTEMSNEGPVFFKL